MSSEVSDSESEYVTETEDSSEEEEVPKYNQSERAYPKPVKITAGLTKGDPKGLRARALRMHENMTQAYAVKKVSLDVLTKAEMVGLLVDTALSTLPSPHLPRSPAEAVEVHTIVQQVVEGCKETPTYQPTVASTRAIRKRMAEKNRREGEVEGEEGRYVVGICTDIGKKNSNEDTYQYKHHLHALYTGKEGGEVEKVVFIGVYDGHSGDQAARYAREQHWVHFMRQGGLVSKEGAAEAMRQSFLSLDLDFLNLADHMELNCGTTALAVVLWDEQLVVGNCGDGRAVMVKADGSVVELAACHSPNDEAETERIKAAGGIVVRFGKWRVNGVLAVSRSIGDRQLANVVIPDADVQVHQLDESCRAIVLASDGLWDVFTVAEVGKMVAEREETEDVEEIAKWLVKQALNMHSKDNITVVVVRANRMTVASE